MNEIEGIKKIAENQGESQTPPLTKKMSFSCKQWDLGKKSTQASSQLTCEINQTQTSLNNIYGENKFKIQYEIIKKEEISEKRNEKRFSKFEVKIDHRKGSKNKALSTARTSENFNFRSEFIEIKSCISMFTNNNNNIEPVDSASKFLKGNNSNIGLSHSTGKRMRKDAFGVPIAKKAKMHKVSFLDLLLQKKDFSDFNNKANSKVTVNFLGLESKNKLSVGGSNNNNNINNNGNNFYNFAGESGNSKNKFVEEIKIESFKKYNLRTNEEDNRKVLCSPCGCNIF